MSSLCLMLIKSSWLNSGLELATLTLLDTPPRDRSKNFTTIL